MTADRLIIISLAGAVAIGFALGALTIRGCEREKIVNVTRDTTIYVIPDSAKAAIYAEGVAEGRALRPPARITRITERDTIVIMDYDPEAVAAAEAAYAAMDSVLAEHEGLKDIVASGEMDSLQFHADLRYRIRDRSFAGTRITVIGTDTTRITDCTRTFWDRFSLGISAGVGAVAIGTDHGVAWKPGAFIGPAISFEF